MAQGLTFENKAGLEMQQAVALGIRAKESTFYKCGFRGYQDTLFVAAGTQFFRDCQIFGTIDFIFGNSKAVFQNCVIAARKPKTRSVHSFDCTKQTTPEREYWNCLTKLRYYSNRRVAKRATRVQIFFG